MTRRTAATAAAMMTMAMAAPKEAAFPKDVIIISVSTFPLVTRWEYVMMMDMIFPPCINPSFV